VLVGDVGAVDEAKRLAGEALEQFGMVDILVNDAAIRPCQGFLEISEAEWRRVTDLDLNAAMHFARLPARDARAGLGRIVNFTGLNAIMGSPNGAYIAAAKQGVWGLTKALAREVGPKGVTVNAISPRSIAPNGGDIHDPGSADQIARVPFGRQGTGEEIAVVCGMLCSEEGSYVFDQMIADCSCLRLTQSGQLVSFL
jgi:3-oxoacyl-[acyl-carrier protein] reductase